MRRRGVKHRMPIAKRRSISIDTEVDANNRQFIALAVQSGHDIDYTTTFNMFAELGQKILIHILNLTQQKAIDEINKFIQDMTAKGLQQSLSEELWKNYEKEIVALLTPLMNQMLDQSRKVLDKYTGYDELKEAGIIDEWSDFQTYKQWKQMQQQVKVTASVDATATVKAQ